MKLRKRWTKMLVCMALVTVLGSTAVMPYECLASSEKGDEAFQEQGDEKANGAVTPDNLTSQGYDVVFCIDNSRSVWSHQEIRDQALRSIGNLAVGADIRIGGVYFADSIYKKLGLTSMENKDGSMEVLQNFLNLTEKDDKNIDTNMGTALEVAQSLFENQDVSRKRIVILFSDGINENLAQDPGYKAAADAKTKTEVLKLREKDIPIYCVYLQKSRNDEAYLKQVVNYFDTNNTYDQERFKKVTEAEINTLSEEFAKIFYSMQNDMKYREISMDSLGKTTFYVPALGVNKLQLYLKNDAAYEVSLESPDGKTADMESWTDGNSAYISVKNPAVGEWTLNVSGDNKESTKGTIAYYTDLSASAVLVPQGSIDGKVHKNTENIVRVRFFDGKGEEVQADSAAKVSVKVLLQPEGGEEKTTELQLQDTNKGYESENFVLDEYGTYSVKVRMEYEDFVDLSYSIDGGEIVGCAPIAKNKKEIFYADKHEKKEVFKIKTSDLYIDPEGEEVLIEKVVQMNEKNPVEVSEKDGFITVAAKKAGDIKFALNLKDASGLTSTVTVEGKVQDRLTMKIIQVLIIILILCILYLIIARRKNKKFAYREALAEKEKFQESYEVISSLYQDYLEESKKLEEIREALETVIENLSETCEETFTEAQKEEWDIQKYLENDFIEQRLAGIKGIGDDFETEKGVMDTYNGAAKNPRKNDRVKALEEVLEKNREYRKQAQNAEEMLREKLQEYRKSLEELEDEVGDISEKYCDIMDFLEREIKCSLKLKWNKYKGYKNCRSGRNYLKGCYCLDDVELLSLDGVCTIKDILQDESTNIFVYGYEDENGKEGLELRSISSFKIRDAAAGNDGKETKKAQLLRGREYRLNVKNVGILNIRVE